MEISNVMMRALSSVINNGDFNEELSEGELKALLELSHKHDLANLVGLALQKKGLLLQNEVGKAFESCIYMSVFRYERIKFELERLSRILEEGGVPFIPLKGSVIRQYYPEPWMRTSADVDILVHKSDLDRAAKLITEKTGYKSSYYSQYDVSFRSNSGVHIELHFDLVEAGTSEKTVGVLKTAWDRTVLKEGCSYHRIMTDEMFYFYHIAHMAKHFKNGGCGVRSFLDLHILGGIPFDSEGRGRLLFEGGLSDFAAVAEKTAKAWFGGGEHTEETRLLEEYILFGGVFGNSINKAAIMDVTDKKVELFSLKKLFKPYDELKYWYPVLEKHKILLPFYEVRRWYDVAFGGTMKRKLGQKGLSDRLNDETLEKTKRLFDILNISD